MRLALLVVLCLLAGCASSPATAPDASGAANVTRANAATGGAASNASAALAPSTTPPKVTTVKVSLAAAEPGLGPQHPLSEPTDTEKGALVLDAPTRSVLVEARWACASPTCGFFLWVVMQDGQPLESASGQGAARILTTKLVPGSSYTLALRSSGPAAQMTGEIRASQFDGAVPEGYSAFAGAKA